MLYAGISNKCMLESQEMEYLHAYLKSNLCLNDNRHTTIKK